MFNKGYTTEQRNRERARRDVPVADAKKERTAQAYCRPPSPATGTTTRQESGPRFAADTAFETNAAAT